MPRIEEDVAYYVRDPIDINGRILPAGHCLGYIEYEVSWDDEKTPVAFWLRILPDGSHAGDDVIGVVLNVTEQVRSGQIQTS